MSEVSLNRKQIIQEVLSDLNSLKDSGFLNQYAIYENINFFKASRSLISYIIWILTKARKINRELILEFMDLPFPRWEEMAHEKLIEMSKKNFPWLIAPLVNQIIKMIMNLTKLQIVADLGCGAMETNRQIIKKLIDLKYKSPIVFVGIDRSSVVAPLIKENLKEFDSYINFKEVNCLNSIFLNKLIAENKKQYLVIFCKNDIFSLNNYFHLNTFDIIFHTLFEHHLNSKEKTMLKESLGAFTKNIIEYDGYRSWINLIIESIIGWRNPIFLNAVIFSRLRYKTKKELMFYAKENKKNIKFFWYGFYLLY